VHRKAATSRKPTGTAIAALIAVMNESCPASRFCRMARQSALPSTEPTCRAVFMTPEAAPARRGLTFRVAIVCIGDIVQPTPSPAIT
jgi:hypothetical protein